MQDEDPCKAQVTDSIVWPIPMNRYLRNEEDNPRVFKAFYISDLHIKR